MTAFNHKTVDGVTLTYRLPAGCVGRIPLIILCHGFFGIREFLLPAYAEAFTRKGFATVTFDYRGFGESDGARGQIVPSMQITDILSVVKWAREQPEIDGGKIGLWGTSLGGCHVFGVAAQDDGIACIVSQLAFADGEAVVTSRMDDREKRDFVDVLDQMENRKKNTGNEIFVGVTSVLSDTDSRKFFEQYRNEYPGIDIKIPFLTVRETLQYKPVQAASLVKCPVLVVIAGGDRVIPPEQGRLLFEAVGTDVKMLYEENKARHYDLYTGEHFERVICVETDWFDGFLR
jgi:dipeptidyl aminopeptidase/acylaminoacyl peptidase